MNTEKFTPGKWEVSLHELHDDIFDNLEYRIWKCGENKLIAQFETWDTTRFAESKANAALISAAPEMYQMLKQLHGTLSKVPVLQGEIEKVLKKARGEEQ